MTVEEANSYIGIDPDIAELKRLGRKAQRKALKARRQVLTYAIKEAFRICTALTKLYVDLTADYHNDNATLVDVALHTTEAEKLVPTLHDINDKLKDDAITRWQAILAQGFDAHKNYKISEDPTYYQALAVLDQAKINYLGFNNELMFREAFVSMTGEQAGFYILREEAEHADFKVSRFLPKNYVEPC